MWYKGNEKQWASGNWCSPTWRCGALELNLSPTEAQRSSAAPWAAVASGRRTQNQLVVCVRKRLESEHDSLSWSSKDTDVKRGDI